jgi:hypothetical protein
MAGGCERHKLSAFKLVSFDDLFALDRFAGVAVYRPQGNAGCWSYLVRLIVSDIPFASGSISHWC